MSLSRREPAWRRYLRFLRADVAADVDDELEFHLAMRTGEYERRGMSADDARRAAQARFGDVGGVAQWLREHDQRRQRARRRRETMSTIVQHLRLAVRSLAHHPAFGGAAVLTLALGIGATTAIFGVVNGVLLEPLPYADAGRLVSVTHTTPAVPGGAFVGQSHAGYETYRRLSRTIEDAGIHFLTAASISDGATPERVVADSVTATVFSTLRITPVVGRFFRPEEEKPGHAPVVLISERLWQRHFGGDQAVAGRSILVDGRPHEILGVVPREMRYPDAGVDVWVPLEFGDTDPIPASLRYQSVARLRPGVTIEAAARELNALIPRRVELFPNAVPGMTMQQYLDLAREQAVVRPLRDDIVGDIGTALWVVLGTIGFVLLAACTNVATLFLVRAEGRQRELAVRGALGAGRWDAAARFLAEGTVVAVAGAVLGVAAAYVALGALRGTTAFPIPRLAEIDVDRTVLLVAGAVTVVVALFSSALPMLRFGGRDLSPILRAGGRGSTTGRDRRRVQGTLVAAQVALAFVLLAASTLMARTFVELRRVRPGFDTDHQLVFRVALPSATYPSDTSIMQLYDRMTSRLSSIAGAEAVGFVSWVPLDKDGMGMSTVFPEGEVMEPGEVPPATPLLYASPGYFASMGIAFMGGQTFRTLPPDRRSDEVIVSAAFASRAWGEAPGSAVGRRVRFLPTGPWMTVVGVVGDLRQQGLEQEASPAVYLPLSSAAYGEQIATAPWAVAVVLRTRGDPETLVATSRREVAALDPTIPVYAVRTMREVLSQSMARTSITTLMLLVAAAVAMALGAIGLYGVVSYTVGMRTREIGLRLALGEPPSSVIGRFARQGALLAAAGVGAGLVGALLVTRVLRGLLYGVGPSDPLMLGVAAVLLVLTALVASWLPARRAARLDPATVLSAD